MDLIIVESPSKAKTISKYLKGKYRVDASGGHVRDLPEKRLGVNIDKNFEPTYVDNPDKKQVIKRLSEEAAKAEHVYPRDRPGPRRGGDLLAPEKRPEAQRRQKPHRVQRDLSRGGHEGIAEPPRDRL